MSKYNKDAILFLDPTRTTRWTLNINEDISDSFLINEDILLINQKTKKMHFQRIENYVFQKEKFKGNCSHCDAYCSYCLYLNKKWKIDFKSVVLHLYYNLE